MLRRDLGDLGDLTSEVECREQKMLPFIMVVCYGRFWAVGVQTRGDILAIEMWV